MSRRRTILTCALAGALATLVTVAGAPEAAAKKQNPDTAPASYDLQAQQFYRWVACGEAPADDDRWDVSLDAAKAKVVEAHCKWMRARYAEYRKRFVDKASKFFAEVRPAGLPKQVVYPFGGGDVVTALVVYPEAEEVTTISLEHAGDPTRLAGLTAKQLKAHLAAFRKVLRGLLTYTDSASATLRKLEKGPVPGQLSMFIAGMTALGYQPRRLRYFHLADDGAVTYYTMAEVAALESKQAKKKSGGWVDPDWSMVFSNAELEFARQGADGNVEYVIHRHISANLHDDHFGTSTLKKHLDAKGARLSLLTKAASYLLWQNGFSGIRTWLGEHLAWMVSDSTGIPPRHARAMGLEQTAYGKFVGAMYTANKTDTAAFAKLWKAKHRKLSFRFGYRDTEGSSHLLITAPAAEGAAK